MESPPEPAQRSKDEDPRAERVGPRKRRRIARDEKVEESEADGSADEFRASGEADSDEEETDELAGDEDDDPTQLVEPRTLPRQKRGPGHPCTPKTPRTPRRPRADKVWEAALRRRKKTALAVPPSPPTKGTLEQAPREGLEPGGGRAGASDAYAARCGAPGCAAVRGDGVWVGAEGGGGAAGRRSGGYICEYTVGVFVRVNANYGCRHI